MNINLQHLNNIQDSDFETAKGRKELKDYLYQLQEQLRYVLNNIDLDSLSSDLASDIQNTASQIVKLSNRIGLLVTENNGTDTIAAASIIAEINRSKSRIQIAADRVEVAPGEALISQINGVIDGTKILSSALDLVEYATQAQAQQYAANAATEAVQTLNSIIMTVLEEYTLTNDFEAFQVQMYSQLHQYADRMEVLFNSAETHTNNVDAAAQAQIQSILSFIRLLPTVSASQQGGVVIGESTNPIKMKLENDVLYFYACEDYEVNTNNAIAYFASGKLYVVEIQVQKLSIGTTTVSMNITIVGTSDNRCALFSGRVS